MRKYLCDLTYHSNEPDINGNIFQCTDMETELLELVGQEPVVGFYCAGIQKEGNLFTGVFETDLPTDYVDRLTGKFFLLGYECKGLGNNVYEVLPNTAVISGLTDNHADKQCVGLRRVL